MADANSIMKKIYINKSDSTASVVEKVINSPGETVVLYIPRSSDFASSRSNFLLLKREARAAGKEVMIESVDEDVLELAAATEFKAVNPFFGKRRRAVSDIVAVKAKPSVVKRSTEEREPAALEEGGEDEGMGVEMVSETKMETETARKTRIIKPRIRIHRKRIEKQAAALSREEKRAGLKRFFIATGVTIVITAVVTVVLLVMPRVRVVLSFEKVPWDFVGTLEVSTVINENSFSNDVLRIRGVSFSEKKNLTDTFPASGSEFVEHKAKGTITVYNAYSSEEQDLVENTRFQTPEGKIYRTDSYITIPGAAIVDGKIVPSTAEVQVAADEPGEEYNIGPVSKFRIPGFQGSPKYDGFYGSSTGSMTGGFAGEKSVPTDSDIESARQETVATLEEAIKSQLFLDLPPEIKLLDGAYRFSITDEAVDDMGGGNDEFAFTAVGEAVLVGFLEDDLIQVISKEVKEENSVDLAVWEYNIDYGEIQMSSGGDAFTVPVSIESTWTRPFNKEEFKRNAAGKDEAELKAMLFSIPGVKDIEVAFWPLWVGTVPDKETRIIIDVQ